MLTYQDFLDHIFLRYSGNVKLGLERIHGILEAMGNPNLQLQGIHIAGTNGKGSTSAACEALSLAHGLTTGLNTSPHLVDYCERFRLQGQNIGFQEILDAYHQWESVFQQWDASFFEITTALAFHLFQSRMMETSIFEVGLGGRLDGTNPFRSTVCIITTIAIDHPKSLGDTIAKIAYEKAGIIKEHTPVVIGTIVPEGLEVIREKADSLQAPCLQLGKDFLVSHIHTGIDGTTFDYDFPAKGIRFTNLKANLLGDYQAHNVSLALTAFLLFCESTGKPWNEPAIRQGLSHIHWQGRLQMLSKQPPILLDGAHNDEGIDSLLKNLSLIFPDKKYVFVTAILRDKPFPSMLRKMAAKAKHIYLTKNHSDRAAEIEEQEMILKDANADYEVSSDVLSATKRAVQHQEPDELIIVCGSLHTIAEVLEHQADITANL